MPKTAQFIEETQAEKSSAQNTLPNTRKKGRGDAARIAPWKWKPGQSGNPGGRPKRDIAAEICRAVFENNADAIYKGLAKEIAAGKAYTLQVASDRAYGKLKETKEVTHIHQDVADADLKQRIADLERDLGLAAAIDEAGRAGIAQAGTSKTNGHAKDSDLLPK